MNTGSIEKVIAKVNELTLSGSRIADSASEMTEEELFTESIDDFSTEPLVFEEVSARLLNKVEELFDLSARYNRHVPQYLECCACLEKGIKLLGSAAFTKFVLEKRKYVFPLLDQLSLPKLYQMVSFNFRKIDAALEQAFIEKNSSAYKLIDMEYRFFHLLDRLKATEERIYQINICAIDENSFVRRALMLTDESWNRSYQAKKVKPPVFRKTTAFPVDNQVIREYEGGKHFENHKFIRPDRKPAGQVYSAQQEPADNPVPQIPLQTTAQSAAQETQPSINREPVSNSRTCRVNSGISGGMVSGIRRRCESGFMREVSPSPENTGMAPGYRDLYRCYLMLQHGLSVTGDVFNVSLKDLAILYEYWCFIKLNRLLKDKYQLVSQDIIRISGGGLFVSLIKGSGSRVKYLDPKTGETFTLSYNPKETSLPTVTQQPDNVLRLEKKDAAAAYEYVFDAKYRIDPALPGTDYYNTISHLPGPEVSDINTMHRYRDAIVYQNGASPYERTMFGAYVLFPYHNEEEYRQHRFYRSIDQVNIGGLPFLPSATGLVTEMLDELISDSPESAFERATLPKGIESRLAKVDWSCRDVLVGTLRSKEQLDVCLAHHFYHVPAERVEKHLPVRYVAICQTINLFGKDAGIVYYGAVGNYKAVRRSEITEIPGDSDGLYYRFEIIKWEKLARPIRPKEIEAVVLFTNLFLLKHSTYVSDLMLRSEEEYRFYTELRRRTDAAVINGEDQRNGFAFGDGTILFDGERILALSGGKISGSCTVADFMRRPNTVFRQIMRSIKKPPAPDA